MTSSSLSSSSVLAAAAAAAAGAPTVELTSAAGKRAGKPADADVDNVSDESGYVDDKSAPPTAAAAAAVGPVRVPFLMAEEFTLNL